MVWEKYPKEEIPSWCRLHPSEHECVGGCWGIWHGYVARIGEGYCKGCEYHQEKVDEQKESTLQRT